MEVLHSGRLGGKNLNRVLHRPLSGMNGQETGVPAAVQIVAQQREVRGVFAPLLRRNKAGEKGVDHSAGCAVRGRHRGALPFELPAGFVIIFRESAVITVEASQQQVGAVVGTGNDQWNAGGGQPFRQAASHTGKYVGL